MEKRRMKWKWKLINKSKKNFPSSMIVTRKSLLEKATKTIIASDHLELEFLGTSSALATQTRNVSALALNFYTGSFLFDCGEGTTRQLLRAKGCRLRNLEAVFITHLHGDHFYGLPGLAMRLMESRKDVEPTKIFAPRGLIRILGGMVPLSRRRVELYEIDQAGQIFSNSTLSVKAYPIEHTTQCYGFVIEEKMASENKRRLDRERIEKEYGLAPGPLYRQLAEGQSVTLPNGRVIEPDTVTLANLPTRPPRKVVILGDTCDPRGIAEAAYGADVLVHEATCTNAEKAVALAKKHSTPGMAGDFARRIAARNLILTHFSPRDSLENAMSNITGHGSVAEWERERMQVMKMQAIETFKCPNVFTAQDYWTWQVPTLLTPSYS